MPLLIQVFNASAVLQSKVAGWLNGMPEIAVTRTGSSTPHPRVREVIGANTSPRISGSPQTAPFFDDRSFFEPLPVSV